MVFFCFFVNSIQPPKCSANPITVNPIWKWEFANGKHPIGGCIEYFLKFLFSNFRSHGKDSKCGRKYIFMNYTCCNEVLKRSHSNLQMGKCPIPVAEHSGQNHKQHLTAEHQKTAVTSEVIFDHQFNLKVFDFTRQTNSTRILIFQLYFLCVL